MDKMLIICEGDSERTFCKLILEKYILKNDKEKEYVIFKTNIYNLYKEMEKDYGLDIKEVIKERAKQIGDLQTYKKLETKGFSETFLIFDLDPQDSNFNIKTIEKMIKYFDNETENGKLYINYPMLESFKHFKSIPDLNYNKYEVSLKECFKYKEIINKISCIKHIGKISNKTLDIITKQNLEKFNFISNNNIKNYNMYMENYSQEKLFKLQIKHFNKTRKFYVINTSVLFGIDYY